MVIQKPFAFNACSGSAIGATNRLILPPGEADCFTDGTTYAKSSWQMIHYTQVRQQELTSCPRRTWGNMKPAFPGTSTLPENTGLSISGSQSPPITKKALDPTSRSFVHKQVPATTPRSIPCLPGPTEQLPHPTPGPQARLQPSQTHHLARCHVCFL